MNPRRRGLTIRIWNHLDFVGPVPPHRLRLCDLRQQEGFDFEGISDVIGVVEGDADPVEQDDGLAKVELDERAVLPLNLPDDLIERPSLEVVEE